MATTRHPGPLALLRRNVPPRILQRGEDYFRSGAVLSVQSTKDLARADVRGSEVEPYRVFLRWDKNAVMASCTCPYDWSDICKHAVAVAHALEPVAETRAIVPAAAVAETLTPQADPIDEELARQRELRAKVAKSEKLQVARGRKGDCGSTRLSSPKSGRVWEALLGSDGFAWCSCPDLRTNELGTCKHIEHLRRTQRKPSPAPAVAVLGSRDSRGEVIDPLADIRLSPAALARLPDPRRFDADGFLKADSGKDLLSRTRAVRRMLEGVARRVDVHPEVKRLLDRIENEELTRRRAQTFAERVRASLAGKGVVAPAEWRRTMDALGVKLHPYQVDGVLFVARTPRALLADDMGLGKTIQSITSARLLMELGEVRRTLIVCPSSLKHQWRREIGKVLGEAMEAVVIEGGQRVREELYRKSKAPFLIINYELLIKDLPKLRAVAPELVIVDEAQRIKNWNTKTAKAVKGFWSPRVLVLTGTPMENRLGELHSVAEHLEPRVLGPMWRLMPEFAETEVREKRAVVRGFKNLSLVRARLAPHFLRRERSLVLSQLPPRTDQIFPVGITEDQLLAHNDHAANAARIASKKFLTEADVLRLMAELASMRMIANGMLLYEWEKVEKVVRRGGALPGELLAKHPSPKLAEFASVLEELLAQKGTKVVVFSQWERMLRLAAAGAHGVMDAAQVRPLFFHGQLTSKERAEAIADFHDDPQARVFFSTDAGGVGLNLQEAANTVVHLEVPWNPAILEQRVGRVHRMGQKRPIQVVSLITESCIEARIAAVVEQKRALFDGLFKGDSDEVRFDDETRTSLVDRVKEILGDKAAVSEPTLSLVERRRAIDEETRQAKDGIADLSAAEPEAAPITPTGAVATGLQLPAAASPLTETPVAAPGEAQAKGQGEIERSGGVQPPELTVDLGKVAQGLLGLLGMPAAAAPATMPITVRRTEGRISIDLPDVPEAAWQHLSAFAAALAGGGPRPQ